MNKNKWKKNKERNYHTLFKKAHTLKRNAGGDKIY